MKKETLIRVIDEEFGDAQEWSWLIDVFYRAAFKNDRKVNEATKEYWLQSKLVLETLADLFNHLRVMEKQELENGVRIMVKRPTEGDDK